eukprot:m.859641 g.859641  ORF g.859641 m.859641 type:complete len:326 (-) comp59672_c0_seq37:2685-3662(-)
MAADPARPWGCIWTDEAATYCGVCGEQSAVCMIETRGRGVVVAGGVREWGVARAAWAQCWAALPSPAAVAIALPDCSTRAHVHLLLQSLFLQFPLDAIFLTNVWVPTILGHGMTSGIALHMGDTACSIAPVIDLFVLHEAITRIPVGINDMTPAVLQQIADVRCLAPFLFFYFPLCIFPDPSSLSSRLLFIVFFDDSVFLLPFPFPSCLLFVRLIAGSEEGDSDVPRLAPAHSAAEHSCVRARGRARGVFRADAARRGRLVPHPARPCTHALAWPFSPRLSSHRHPLTSLRTERHPWGVYFKEGLCRVWSRLRVLVTLRGCHPCR